MKFVATVETFLAALDHPFKREIFAVRRVVLASDPRIEENIKWNAPSFYTTDYFATVHLHTKNGGGVILYFGAKKNDISKNGVEIDDPNALLN